MVFAGAMLLLPHACAQIQSTISCPAGYGYWDVLSVMMMDPGLAPNYHMEGYNSSGNPDAYMYTTWVPSQNKVWYVKNPQGYPWDINLYDDQPSIPQQGFIYQWVTEVSWSSDSECKKFNNGSGSQTADFSFRWAARCAAPGGANSSIWNPPPPSLPYNSNYYTISSGTITKQQNLGYTLLELKPTATITLYDTRTSPATSFSATDLPLQYTYSCYLQEVDACATREVFDYAVDTNVNPVDGQKHSYGWVQWRRYNNTAYVSGKNPPNPANWVESTNPPPAVHDHLVVNQVPIDFKCF
jgi:hypothetical protein